MPSFGKRCRELRVRDRAANWRVIYRVGDDAIVLLEVFSKKTGKTPTSVIRTCRQRAREYDELV